MKDNQKQFIKRVAIFVVVYFMIALGMYWVVADDWRYTAVETDSVSKGYVLPGGSTIVQELIVPMDGLEGVVLTPHYEEGSTASTCMLSIVAENETLWNTQLNCTDMESDQRNFIEITPCLNAMSGHRVSLLIQPGEGNVSFWAGNTMPAGKLDIAVETKGLFVNDIAADGQLVLSLVGHNVLHAAGYYWPIAIGILFSCLVIAVIAHEQRNRGKRTALVVTTDVCSRYVYLLKQLVWRDFRVKYQSSALGMLWSFLNPLLTMGVYYFVFSAVFQSDIPYFPVYLMSGIILFNYFSESTSLGLVSIVGNSALITKVYMPKYIYPLSKVLSSAINLCISLIPLILVMLVTGVPFQKSLLLLPWVVLFLILFSLGVSLILSTMNVFFRDTQFLWNVLITLWNFLTPIFYPESIIPAQFRMIYHLNPMYQIVYFMRSIILNGVSPTPITYFYCLLASGIPCIIGLYVFRKNQDKFVLHL